MMLPWARGVIELDGAEDVRDFERFADATRAAGDGDALVVEQKELAFTLDKFGAEIERIADAERTGFRAVQFDVLDFLPEAVVKAALQHCDVLDGAEPFP